MRNNSAWEYKCQASSWKAEQPCLSLSSTRLIPDQRLWIGSLLTVKFKFLAFLYGKLLLIMYCHGKRTQKESEELADMYYKTIILDYCVQPRLFFPHVSTALLCLGLLIVEVSRSHSNTPRPVGLLWTSDRLVAKAATYTTHYSLSANHQWPIILFRSFTTNCI
jgi:hypothetical protein